MRGGYGRFVFARQNPTGAACEPMISLDLSNKKPRLQRNLGRPPAVALRAMLRFLINEGQVPRGLEAAVPMPHQWRLASLPRHLNKEQVSQCWLCVKRPNPTSFAMQQCCCFWRDSGSGLAKLRR